jgi:metal-responsive CopG/Arc/MetJ family transcriptional regulator
VLSARVAISLPAELLERVEQARPPGQSRSNFIATAIESFLNEQQAQARAYAEGYARFPESAEEIAEADGMSIRTLAAEPFLISPP